jgi:uncharacterized delta-60 repeat protein
MVKHTPVLRTRVSGNSEKVPAPLPASKDLSRIVPNKGVSLAATLAPLAERSAWRRLVFAVVAMATCLVSVANAADGGLDGSFNAGGSGADSEVYTVASQPDGKIIIGGSFTTYDGDALGSHFLMRLNADGTRDRMFNPGGAGPDSYVSAVAIQSDGKILIGGLFTSYDGDAASSDKIMRLNADGTRDATFNPGGTGADGNVFAITLQTDGRILIGGFFTSYNGDAAANDAIMRLNQDGTRDTSFNSGGTGVNGGGVYAIAIQADGRIVIGGGFNSYNGDSSVSDGVTRLNANGTPDVGFNTGGSGATARVVTLAVQADGKTLVGGWFFAYNGDNSAQNLIRVNPDGTRDATFNSGGSGADGPVTGLVIQNNGKIVIGGGFKTYNGDPAASDSIMRLNVDGTRDSTFNPGGTGANSPVDAVTLQADGKVVAAGLFTSYNGDNSAPDRVMRLLAEAAPAMFSFSQPAYTVAESDGSITIIVNRVGDTSTPATVDYATADGGAPCGNLSHSASEKCDFTTAVGTLSFAPGDVARTFVVLISQDTYVEGPETFSVVLSNPQGAVLLSPFAVVTINDDLTEPPGNAIDDPANFVRQHYHDFLNREPDQSGWDFWTGQITSCGNDASCIEAKRINASGAFFLSIEFQQTGYLVERMYKVAYGDATSTSSTGGSHQILVPMVRFREFLRDTQRIGSGVVILSPGWEQALENNKQAYALEFVQTSRFKSAYPETMTSDQFVDQLNQNAGNVLSPSERQTMINIFGSAHHTTDITVRAQALRQVAENQNLFKGESNRAFVLAQYFGYLRRNPSDLPDSDYTGYEFWLTKLNQFNGDYVGAEMVKAFINSSEYRQRFGQP